MRKIITVLVVLTGVLLYRIYKAGEKASPWSRILTG